MEERRKKFVIVESKVIGILDLWFKRTKERILKNNICYQAKKFVS